MRIIHLFADLCNLYGDYGNVCGLKRALENKGQNVEVEYQSIDDEIDVSGADLVFIGSATERNQKVALEYLQGYTLYLAKQVKLRLALEKIAQIENVSVTDEDVEKEYAEMAENYKMELDKVKALVAEDALRKDLEVEKAFDIVRESADVTEVTE